MRLPYNIFGAQMWFLICNSIEPVYINSGKPVAGNFSRNMFLDFFGVILGIES